MKHIVAAACVPFLLTTAANAGTTIDIHDAWIRFIPGDRPMAGYFIVDNTGDRDRRLIGASSPAFDAVHMHETVEQDGAASMQPVDVVTVPALGRVEFSPGGYHLMLMQRQENLRIGDQVSITVAFEDGGSQSALFTIEPSWRE